MGKNHDFSVRKAAGKKFRLWHGVFAAILVIAVSVGLNMANMVAAVTVPRPAPSVTDSGVVRNIPSDLSDLSNINLGPNTPGTPPGTLNQPVPIFSGIDIPWMLNSNAGSSVEIYDDTIIHGLTDVRGGLINNGAYTAIANLLIDGSITFTPVSPPVGFGSTITISGTVKNQGSGSAAASTTRLRIDLNNNGSWDINQTVATGTLNRNQSQTASFTWTANTEGTHRAEICANQSSAPLSESRTDDNCTSNTLRVNPQPILTLNRDIINEVNPFTAGTDRAILVFLANVTNGPVTINSIKVSKIGNASGLNFTNIKLKTDTNIDVGEGVYNATTGIISFTTLNEEATITTSKKYKVVADIGAGLCGIGRLDFKISAVIDMITTPALTPTINFPPNGRTLTACSSLFNIRQHPNDFTAALGGPYMTNIPLVAFTGSTTTSSVTLQSIIFSKRNHSAPPPGTRNATNFSIGKIEIYNESGLQLGVGSYDPSSQRITATFSAPITPISINSTKNYYLQANACSHYGETMTTDWLYFDIASPADVNVREPSVTTTVNPFTYTGRWLSLCPTQPTVTHTCADGYYPHPSGINAQWTPLPGNSTYAVEIDDDTNIANGYWKKDSISSTTAIIPQNQFAAVAPKAGTLNLRNGTTYYVRIFYRELELRSNTRYFTPPPNSCQIPAPAIVTSCAGGTSEATVTWSAAGLSNTNYWIDVDADEGTNTFVSAAGGGNGFWNKNVLHPLATTKAPYGFNAFAGAPGPLNLIRNNYYKARVYYLPAALTSQEVRFQARDCIVGNLPKPRQYQRSPIAEKIQDAGFKIFGDFVPTAKANFIETAYAETYPEGLLNPVTVYDDLYVRGNGAEPGNIAINGNLTLLSSTGQIQAAGGIVVGSPGITNQVTGNLRVLGGNLDVVGGVLKGTQIGYFYTVTDRNTPSGDFSSYTIEAAANCAYGDFLVSCSGKLDTGIPANNSIFLGTEIQSMNTVCRASAYKSIAATTQPTIRAQAMCFNTDGGALTGARGDHSTEIVNSLGL